MAEPIYLDNATALPPLAQVLKIMWPMYEFQWANPSSPHDKGQELHHIIKKSYEAVSTALQLNSTAQFILTSSGAEATTQAIFSAFRHGYYEMGKTHISLARFHDAAASMAVDALVRDNQATVSYIDSTIDGIITPEKVLESLTPRTSLVGFPLVHPLTGVIQPIEEIGELCRSRDIPMVVDISHGLGSITIDFTLLPDSYFTIRGEVIGTPQGIGALITTSDRVFLSPLIYGDEHPQLKRGGALNVAGLAGFAEAIETAKRREIVYCTEVCRLKDLFEQELQKRLKDSICFPFSHIEAKAPHITAVIFKGVKNEALLYHLNKKKVYATIGGGGYQNLCEVLEGIGIDVKMGYCALSFCFNDRLTERDVVQAAERIESCYTLLRRISPKGIALE